MEENPWELLYNDFSFVFKHLYDFVVEFILRNTIFSMRFVQENPPTSELNLWYWRNCKSFIYEATWTMLVLPIAVFYPLVMMKGFEKQMVRLPQRGNGEYDDEQWFFVNGIATDKQWLDENCLYIEERFGTGVTGILNKSYGVLWDLVECFLQRSFDVNTISVREATVDIYRALERNNTVRLIGHSQGALIVSLIIRTLFLSLSIEGKQDLLKKLEVYTFANPARYFENPGNLIRRIEHYVNERDPIAKLGILQNVYNASFKGEIFINRNRNGGKGHALNAFYSLNSWDYEPINRTGSAIRPTPTLLNLPGKVDNLPIKVIL